METAAASHLSSHLGRLSKLGDATLGGQKVHGSKALVPLASSNLPEERIYLTLENTAHEREKNDGIS